MQWVRRMAALPGTGATDPILRKAQAGDRRALNDFFTRELPPLRRWAQQRLPVWLHRRADPDDIVQIAAIKTLRRLRHLDTNRESVRPYMRQAVLNLIRDEVRAARRSPDLVDVEGETVVARSAPTDVLFARDTLKSYRAALRRLPAGARAAVVARVERGWNYERIARELGKRPQARHAWPSAVRSRRSPGRCAPPASVTAAASALGAAGRYRRRVRTRLRDAALTIPGRDKSFDRFSPWHDGHVGFRSPVTNASNSRSQSPHWYSKMGMGEL